MGLRRRARRDSSPECPAGDEHLVEHRAGDDRRARPLRHPARACGPGRGCDSSETGSAPASIEPVLGVSSRRSPAARSTCPTRSARRARWPSRERHRRGRRARAARRACGGRRRRGAGRCGSTVSGVAAMSCVRADRRPGHHRAGRERRRVGRRAGHPDAHGESRSRSRARTSRTGPSATSTPSAARTTQPVDEVDPRSEHVLDDDGRDRVCRERDLPRPCPHLGSVAAGRASPSARRAARRPGRSARAPARASRWVSPPDSAEVGVSSGRYRVRPRPARNR